MIQTYNTTWSKTGFQPGSRWLLVIHPLFSISHRTPRSSRSPWEGSLRFDHFLCKLILTWQVTLHRRSLCNVLQVMQLMLIDLTSRRWKPKIMQDRHKLMHEQFKHSNLFSFDPLFRDRGWNHSPTQKISPWSPSKGILKYFTHATSQVRPAVHFLQVP